MARLRHGVLRKGFVQSNNNLKLNHGGRVILPGGTSDRPPFSIGRLESIFKGEDKPKFCIIRRLGGIGDVLMTTPLARGLKKKWPGCHVTYATDKDYMNGALVDILRYNPYIDEIIPYQILKSRTFDATADITSVCTKYEKAGNAPINRVDLFSHASGIPLFEDRLPIYVITEEEQEWAKTFLRKYNVTNKPDIKWIGIQARSNSDRRNWPIENVKLLAARLAQQQNIKVIIFDNNTSEQWNIHNVIPVINFNIRQVAALVDAMDLLVCHDSGLLHIAGALEKRIVSLFGSSDPGARINYYENAIAVEDNALQCLHCWYSKCNFKYACMKNISVNYVYDTTIQHLQNEIFRKKQVNISTPNANITLIRRSCGGLGDMIMITPVLKGLKENFPTKKIHLMIPDEYNVVFENNPNIDRIIPINDAIYNYYDRKYDISNVCAKYECEMIQIKKQAVDKTRPEVFCDHVGIKPSSYKPELFLSEDEYAWAKRFLKDYKDNIIVATSLRCADVYRDWPLKHYNRLFKMVEQKMPNVRFLVVDKERKWDFLCNNIIDGAGFPFRKFLSLVEASDLVLTPDTSLLHMANAFNKPTVALFGPIDYHSRCKYYPNTKVIIDETVDCLPCWRNSHIPCSVTGSLEKSQCMENIKSKVVFAELKKIIKFLER